jgi:target of rapamycin complex 2 subunit MAPKAP1
MGHCFLISSYLIHSIRLNYLRNVDDPYGSRLITLSSSYTTNPYVLASGLADVGRWPELALPNSPAPSDDEDALSSRPGLSASTGRFGARGLRHTQTIMGPNRTGALGMRVHARRTSGEAPKSLKSHRRASGIPESPPPGEALAAPAAAAAVVVQPATAGNTPEAQRKSLETPRPSLDRSNSGHQKPSSEQANPPTFVPMFKGAAEMEARRRQRMAMRAQVQQGGPPPAPVTPLNPELSSDEEEEEAAPAHESGSSGDSDFDELQDALGLDSDMDEFDP